MEKIALIAGNGNLPYFFYKAAKEKSYEVFPIGLFDTVSDKLQKVENYVRMNIGELGKLVNYLLINKIDKVIMLGKVEKSLIFQDLKLDNVFQNLVFQLPDRKDETLVFGVMSILKENGVEILPQNYLMDTLLTEEKVYTKLSSDEIQDETIKIGIEGAKALGKIDVGQTVVAKNRAIVALEAIEGTDETIKRAGLYAGEDCIVVKMSRPQQDMRVDVPAIGMKTFEEALKIKAKGIVIEAGKVLFLDKEEVIKKADENNMFIMGVKL